MRNKTDPPDVGKYNPTRKYVEATVPAKSIIYKEYSTEAKVRKVDYQFNQSKICSSLVKSLMLDSNAIVGSKGKTNSIALPMNASVDPQGDNSGSH